MNPVVVGCTLEGLAGKKRSTLLLLSQPILFFCFVNEFFLHALFFSIAVGFLFVRHLWLLVEVVFSVSVWTEHALVGLLVVSNSTQKNIALLTYDTLSFLSFLHVSQYHLFVCRGSSIP
jgi:hypothetical protein